jgi:anti-anti-sigma factor
MAIKVGRREEADGIAVLTLGAEPATAAFEVDLLASEDVESALKGAVADGKAKIVVDLAGVAYMHSRAFWAIVRAAEECVRRGGGLVLVGLSPYLTRLVELTSAAESIQARGDVVEAVVLLRKGP